MDSKKTKAKKAPFRDYRRRRTAVSAKQLLGRLLDRSVRQRGFAQAEILARWPEIVGEDIARAVMPVRLKMPPGSKMGGTLEVRTESAFAPMLQHREHFLIERINGFYGFGAVARLSIRQGPVQHHKRRMKTAPTPLDATQEKSLETLLEPAGTTDLAAVLERLGREVLGRK